jgi:hypothetical protein
MLLCGCVAAASAAATALAEANEKELALRAQLAELQQAASSMSDRAVMDATYAKAAKIDDVEEQLVAALDDLSEAKQELGEVKSELGEVKSELGEVRQENARLGTTMDAMGATMDAMAATMDAMGAKMDALMDTIGFHPPAMVARLRSHLHDRHAAPPGLLRLVADYGLRGEHAVALGKQAVAERPHAALQKESAWLLDILSKSGCGPALFADVGAATRLGWPAAALVGMGWTAAQLRDGGYSAQACLAVRAQCGVAELQAVFGLAALQSAGMTAADALEAGAEAAQLKPAGYSAQDCQAAGCTAQELRAAGFGAAAVMAACGLTSVEDVVAVGFSKAEAVAAGAQEDGFVLLGERMPGGWLPAGKRLGPLLFRMTRDGSQTSAFHARVDGQGATLTVAKTSKQNVFGGYVTQSWNSSGNAQTDATAWTFVLKNPKGLPPTKYALKAGKRSHYCHPSSGPSFGGNFFHVANPMTTGSCCSVGNYYNVPNVGSDTCAFVDGACAISYTEIEVFQVV